MKYFVGFCFYVADVEIYWLTEFLEKNILKEIVGSIFRGF